ncbi:MAG: hypothetical protein WBM07_01985 [Chitinivibrionales bacterium]
MKRTAACFALILSVFYSSTFAIGALYARRAGTNGTSAPLWISNYEADATITDQIAVTHVDETFEGTSKNTEKRLSL